MWCTGLACSEAHGIFLDQGSNLWPLLWQALLTTGPLESPSLFIKHILCATPCAHGWLFVCDMYRAGSLPDPSMVLIWVWLPHFKVAKRDGSGNIEQSAIIQRTGEWSALPLSSWCCLPPPGVSTSPQHSLRPRASSWTASQHT